MQATRTTEQVACDGVRTAWAETLAVSYQMQRPAVTLSMDGVVRRKDVHPIPKRLVMNIPGKKRIFAKPTVQNSVTFDKLFGSIDGVRLPRLQY